jgi:hypothetical protein
MLEIMSVAVKPDTGFVVTGQKEKNRTNTLSDHSV